MTIQHLAYKSILLSHREIRKLLLGALPECLVSTECKGEVAKQKAEALSRWKAHLTFEDWRKLCCFLAYLQQFQLGSHSCLAKLQILLWNLDWKDRVLRLPQSIHQTCLVRSQTFLAVSVMSSQLETSWRTLVPTVLSRQGTSRITRSRLQLRWRQCRNTMVFLFLHQDRAGFTAVRPFNRKPFRFLLVSESDAR
mgnify:CR=1 FL=1